MTEDDFIYYREKKKMKSNGFEIKSLPNLNLKSDKTDILEILRTKFEIGYCKSDKKQI